MKPSKEQLEKFAEWWAVKSFDIALNQNNGDDSPNGGMAFMLMNMASMKAKETITTESRQKFKDSIVRQLLGRDRNLTLDVDYHPCEELAIACQVAGVNCGILPCKTFSDFRDGKFVAKYQYGGKLETL